jgi:hypothetical protein
MPVPQSVKDDPKAREILRAWIAHKRLHLTFSPTTWDDPAEWGILIVDLMRHLARAYEAENLGKSDNVFARIRAGLDAELASPTDEGTTDANRTH